jgi:TraY domain-containing protein
MKVRRSKYGGGAKRDPKPGERVMLGTRVTPELKQRLDAAAEHSGRSQAQEIEFRLERSFDRGDLLTDVLEIAFGQGVAGLLLAVGIAMDNAGRRASSGEPGAPPRWSDQPLAYDQATQAAQAILTAFQPRHDKGKISSHATDADRAGAKAAREVILAIVGDKKRPNRAEIAAMIFDRHSRVSPERLRTLLGPIAERAEPSGDE